MKIKRRDFLKVALASSTGVAVGSSARAQMAPDSGPASAAASGPASAPRSAQRGADQHAACLVDTALCVGCRKCEEACNRANELPKPDKPFDDKTVIRTERRPTDQALTVVNQYPGAPSRDQKQRRETHAKVQCMHCLDPACVSACIVGALTKSAAGPVQYNARICLGCRYCMVACPFEIPAYQYNEALAPRVVKCEFCTNNKRGPKANPACAEICPVEALVFGKRGDLLTLARKRIGERPDRYLDVIYGEREVGGTSWLYLMGRPQREIGLIKLPSSAPPRVTENIQHTIFKFGAIPIAVYGALGALMWRTSRLEQANHSTEPAGSDRKR